MHSVESFFLTATQSGSKQGTASMSEPLDLNFRSNAAGCLPPVSKHGPCYVETKDNTNMLSRQDGNVQAQTLFTYKVKV